MYNHLKIPAFNSQLTIRDHVTAMQSIESFVDSYSLAECRDFLWKMLRCALTSENDFEEAIDRGNIILFTQIMEEMAEVLHFMYKDKADGKIN